MLSDFGFTKIPFQEKTERIKDLFSRVSGSYDLMNDAMSFGIHRLWKDDFMTKLPLKPGMKVLDLAGGTADISLRLLQKYPFLEPDITVCDLTFDMLKEGGDRLVNEGIIEPVNWVCGNGEYLPFEDESFDLVICSFGIRNFSRIHEGLKQIKRVLKKGGQFACLEFSQIDQPLFKKAYDFYAFQVIPKMGQFLAKDHDAYQYLVESIEKFPDAESFKKMMEEAGFSHVSWSPYCFGVAAIHQGTV